MNAQVWTEIILGVPTLLGGGGVVVSKLTRIAVGLEKLAEQVSEARDDIKETAATVADHERRLTKGGL